MVLTYEQERALVKGILTESGFAPEDADTIGKVITHSDFTGVYSHGLSRLTRYLRQIKVGALNKDPDAMPEQLLENVNDGINEFVQGAEQFDDITMLSLKYFGPEAAK